MTTYIDQVKNIIGTYTGWAGGSFPDYNSLNEISGTTPKFIVAPIQEGNGTEVAHNIRKYQFVIKADTKAALETAINTLEKYSSASHTSSSYNKNNTISRLLTASDHSFISLEYNNDDSIQTIVTASDQTSPGKFYTEIRASPLTDRLWGMVMRFNYFHHIDIATLTWSLTPGANLVFGESGALYIKIKTSTPEASLTAYNSKTMNFNDPIDTYLLWNNTTGTYLANTEYDVLLTFEMGTIALLNTAIATFQYLDLVCGCNLQNGTETIYGSDDSGKEPALTLTFTVPSDYPYWLDIKFDYDASTKNEFQAVFSIEARWAL